MMLATTSARCLLYTLLSSSPFLLTTAVGIGVGTGVAHIKFVMGKEKGCVAANWFFFLTTLRILPFPCLHTPLQFYPSGNKAMFFSSFCAGL